MNFLHQFFKLKENNTTIRTEVMGGLTTFMTMSYILFVNPVILSKAGLPMEATITATAWAAGISTLLMGFLTNYPIALASGMGINAVVAYNIVIGMGLSWQTAMGVIVIEGFIITILVLTRVRDAVMNSIPLALKQAIGIGIGLFITFIGLKDSGLIQTHPSTWITAGDFSQKAVWISIIGLIGTIVLHIKKVRGSLLIGMAMTTALSLGMGLMNVPQQWVSMPTVPETLFQFDLKSALQWSLVPMIFALFMTDFFDTMGTVIAVSEEGKFVNAQGKLPKLKRVLFTDSLAAMIGGMFSASSVTCYIESSTGIAQGARTGLATIVVGCLFLVSPFLAPLVQMIGGGISTTQGILNPVTAPVLIIVGFLMTSLIRKIQWDQLEESFPAFLTLVGMPLTFSISHGIGFGFISYTLIKILRGKAREIPLALYPISALFAISFLL